MPLPALMRCTSPGLISPLPPVVFMRQHSRVHQRHDFHFAVRVHPKPRLRRDPVVVEHPQHTPVLIGRIVIGIEGKEPMSFEPAVIGIMPVTAEIR